jgi:hypothetical protein
MAKSNRRRKLDRAKAERNRAEVSRLRADAEIASEARRKVDALFLRNVDLRVSGADLAELLVADPDTIDRVIVREDARAASLQDRLRMMLESFPEGPPPSALIFASVAAHLAGNDRDKRRYDDALRTFVRGPGGQEWQERLREGAGALPLKPVAMGGHPRDQKMYRVYLHVVADARQRAIDAALAAEEPVDDLSAADFLSLLGQYASRPSGSDPQLIAKVRARLAEPMSDFLFDQAVSVAMTAMGASVIESLVERHRDRTAALDGTH